MVRTLEETLKAAWEWMRIPTLALSLAGFSCGYAGAVEVLHLDQLERRDVDYQIIPISHHGNCNCAPQCQVDDCYPCQPEGTTSEAGEAGEAADELMMSSPRQIAGGQVGYRGNAGLPGYIEDAFIRSRVRVRYDDMQNSNFPTRANFWYPTIGDFGGDGPIWGDGDAAGSPNDVDFQELSTYVEVAFGPRFSVFADFPIRWVKDVDFGDNSADIEPFRDGQQVGAGDIRAGIRYGLIACPYEALTFQVRGWAPTGEARRALGVGHPSIDLGLLYSVRASQRTQFFGEINDWQTIDAGSAEFGGEEAELDANILRYGAGVGYDLWQSCGCRPQSLTALFEVVGWTVLEGVTTPASFDGTGPVVFTDAEGDTIVNGKYGLRYNWSCTGCGSESVYIGYGHNWTETRWYSDIVRLELTHFF